MFSLACPQGMARLCFANLVPSPSSTIVSVESLGTRLVHVCCHSPSTSSCHTTQACSIVVCVSSLLPGLLAYLTQSNYGYC